jgi:hypothetical protein
MVAPTHQSRSIGRVDQLEEQGLVLLCGEAAVDTCAHDRRKLYRRRCSTSTRGRNSDGVLDLAR